MQKWFELRFMPMLIDLNVLIMNETLSIEYQSQYETEVIMQSA